MEIAQIADIQKQRIRNLSPEEKAAKLLEIYESLSPLQAMSFKYPMSAEQFAQMTVNQIVKIINQ